MIFISLRALGEVLFGCILYDACMYCLFVYEFWVTKMPHTMGKNQQMPDVIFETVPFLAGSIYSGTTSLECSPEHFGKSRCFEKPRVGVR